MKYLAIVEKISDEIDGELLLSVNGVELTCFGYSSLPQDVRAGDICRVELFPTVLDDYIVREAREGEVAGAFRQGNTLSYFLVGRLSDGRLDVGGVIFEDEVLSIDFECFNDRDISWIVDRIDIGSIEIAGDFKK